MKDGETPESLALFFSKFSSKSKRLIYCFLNEMEEILHLFKIIIFLFFLSYPFYASASLAIQVNPGAQTIEIRDLSPTGVKNENLRELLIALAKKFLGERKVSSVLSVGCSDGTELLSCQEAFGSECQITGCDINQEAIKRAKETFKQFRNIKLSHFDFSSNDLSSLDSNYDVILLRHPEPYSSLWNNSSRTVWAKIFKNAQKLLSPGGLIIVTTYFKAEADFFSRQKGRGLALLFSGKNPFFSSKIRKYKEQEFGKDLFIRVFQKTRSFFCF